MLLFYLGKVLVVLGALHMKTGLVCITIWGCGQQGCEINQIEFSIMILASNNYENEIIQTERLLFRIPFWNDVLSFTAHPSPKYQTLWQPGCGMFVLAWGEDDGGYYWLVTIISLSLRQKIIYYLHFSYSTLVQVTASPDRTPRLNFSDT